MIEFQPVVQTAVVQSAMPIKPEVSALAATPSQVQQGVNSVQPSSYKPGWLFTARGVLPTLARAVVLPGLILTTGAPTTYISDSEERNLAGLLKGKKIQEIPSVFGSAPWTWWHLWDSLKGMYRFGKAFSALNSGDPARLPDAAEQFRTAAELYEGIRLHVGVGRSYAMLGQVLARRKMKTWGEVKETISAYKKAYHAFVAADDRPTAELVRQVNAEMLSRHVVGVETIGRQLKEMQFMRQALGDDYIESTAESLQEKFANLPLDVVDSFKSPPEFGSLPYDFLAGYFRAKKRNPIAEQLERYDVAIDEMQVIKWLDVHHRRLDGETEADLLRAAKNLIRQAALSPDFRASFLRADNEVTNAGVIIALDPMDNVRPRKALPSDRTPTVMDEEVVESVETRNHSLLFSAAWAILLRPKNAHLEKKLVTTIINEAMDFVLTDIPKKYLDADGRLVNGGEKVAVNRALKELQTRGLELDFSSLVDVGTIKTSQQYNIEQVHLERSPEAVLHMLDTGKVLAHDWAEKTRTQKQDFVRRLGALIVNYQSDPEAFSRKWPFIVLRVNLEKPDEKGYRARNDVNLHALQWAIDNTQRTYSVESVLSERYYLFKRLSFEARWPKILQVIKMLNSLSESKLLDRTGELKPRRIIDAYIHSQAEVILQGRYAEIAKLERDEFDSLISDVVKILHRDSLDSRSLEFGDITPELVFEAYEVKRSDNSRGAFEDEESTDELDVIEGEGSAPTERDV